MVVVMLCSDEALIYVMTEVEVATACLITISYVFCLAVDQDLQSQRVFVIVLVKSITQCITFSIVAIVSRM